MKWPHEKERRTTCAICEVSLGMKNTSGRCRQHPSEETLAKRGATLRRLFATDPDFRARHKVKAGRQTEAGRKAISDRAKAVNLSAMGRAAMTEETHRKIAKANRDRALAHIASEYRELYSELRNKHRIPVAEAMAAVEQQQEADLARFRRGVTG